MPSPFISILPDASSRREALKGLRQTLADQFPGAHSRSHLTSTSTGVASSPAHPPDSSQSPSEESSAQNAFPITHLTPPLHIPKGEITEAHGDLASASLLVEAILHSASRERAMLALVDASSSFDPALPPSLLSRLLWIMADDAAIALKATDLLLRDGNLPLILLDLQLSPPEQLRRIPSSTWYRFQRILTSSGTALLALTPRPLISSAAVRISLEGEWSLTSLHQRRSELPCSLQLQRRHRASSTTPLWQRTA